jgi:hypothetical protein
MMTRLMSWKFLPVSLIEDKHHTRTRKSKNRAARTMLPLISKVLNR